MTCDRWRDVILLETDGTVPPADRDDLRRHLADCPACRQYAEAVRSVVSALSVECVGPVPARLAHRLRRLAATVEVRPAWRRQVRYWAAAAAALLVAATLVLAFLDRRPDRVRPDDLRDLAGLEIERDLAEIARDIERLGRPLQLALLNDLAAGRRPTTTRALASMPVWTPVARPRFDDELDRVGTEIEALDRPIFGTVSWSEQGGEG